MQVLQKRGIRAEMAKLMLARKIAADRSANLE